jgi:hypothetical protein
MQFLEIGKKRRLYMVVHNCNPSTLEAEGRELQVPGQPKLHSETLSQTNKQTKKTGKKI